MTKLISVSADTLLNYYGSASSNSMCQTLKLPDRPLFSPTAYSTFPQEYQTCWNTILFSHPAATSPNTTIQIPQESQSHRSVSPVPVTDNSKRESGLQKTHSKYIYLHTYLWLHIFSYIPRDWFHQHREIILPIPRVTMSKRLYSIVTSSLSAVWSATTTRTYTSIETKHDKSIKNTGWRSMLSMVQAQAQAPDRSSIVDADQDIDLEEERLSNEAVSTPTTTIIQNQ